MNYEYRVYVCPNFAPPQEEGALNELGADGWELVAVIADTTRTSDAAFCLKRPRRSPTHPTYREHRNATRASLAPDFPDV